MDEPESATYQVFSQFAHSPIPAHSQVPGVVGQPKHQTTDRTHDQNTLASAVYPSAEALMQTLHELGIAENTLIVAMADNGPMTHNPPPGAGLGEGPFRGGKGDFYRGWCQSLCAGMVARRHRARSDRR